MMRELAGDHEDRLNEVLLAYVEALQAGGAPDRGQLLAEHPDLRDDLEAFFAGHDEIERLAAPFRESGSGVRGGECGVKAEERLHPLHSSAVTPHSPPRTPDAEKAEIGRLGDFRLLREVGRGGMGVVYEAEQISLRRRVALKVLPFAAAIDPRQLQRFKNEALAAAHLRHENIVPVHAVGCQRGVHYYAMQFIEGQSLAALIADLRLPLADCLDKLAAGKPASPTASTAPIAAITTERATGTRRYFDWVAGLGRQAALALEYAHETGIVHRDIKPANLLLDPRGQLWVTDFGLAQVTGDSNLTATGELLGTLRYASPEQALGRRGVVDHRSDVYSLGATLYELLTLRPPFDGRDRHELLQQIAREQPPSVRSLTAAVPVELETIVLKALRKDPADRYQTAQELADDLRRYQDHRPILARRPTFPERLRMWSRRHPAVLGIGAITLVLLTVTSVLSAALIRGEQERTRVERERAEAAYVRERARAEEAESRLHLARRAVDELVQVSEEELADRPGMEGVRKRLLRSALAYYEEFIGQRREDPRAQAELVDARLRVANILTDLAVLHAASKLHLLNQPAVLAELRLSTQQRGKVRELTARVNRQWNESFQDIGLVTRTERSRRALEQARTNEADLAGILTSRQQDRLRQIGLQSEGPAAFRDPEVAAALRLTGEQRERIRVIEDDVMYGWMRNRGAPPADIQPPEAKDRAANERILAVLTEDQAQVWRSMIGAPVRGTLHPFPPPPSGPKRD
jgi:serine/threonine protein kinase